MKLPKINSLLRPVNTKIVVYISTITIGEDINIVKVYCSVIFFFLFLGRYCKIHHIFRFSSIDFSYIFFSWYNFFIRNR